MTAKIRRRHERTLNKLLTTALGERGTTDGIQHGTGIPPHITARSLLDADIELNVLASHIPLDDHPDYQGSYPPGSKLVLISISGHHARTLTNKTPNTSETDAWAQAFAPAGYEDYTLTLGRIAKSPSGATHYRHIVGPDGNICVIDPRDEAMMRNSANYT